MGDTGSTQPGPVELLRDLTRNAQLLACLRWFGEFQVLACIPLHCSIPIRSVAELSGVPESQLHRIIQATSTAGFLIEPNPGQVAHTSLSAEFCSKPSYLDATMFLAETGVTAALHMGAATRQFGNSLQPYECGYTVATGNPATFEESCLNRPRLRRQWRAYQEHVLWNETNDIISLLSQHESVKRRGVTIVQVGARTTAIAVALARVNLPLHIIVQLDDLTCVDDTVPSELSSRIKVIRNVPSSPVVEGAVAVLYMLYLPSPSPARPSWLLGTQTAKILQEYLAKLRANPLAQVLLLTQSVASGRNGDVRLAANASIRDMSLLQLSNDRELDLIELLELINSTGDGSGRLVGRTMRMGEMTMVSVQVKTDNMSMSVQRRDGSQNSQVVAA